MENRGFNRNLIKLGYYEAPLNNYEIASYNKKPRTQNERGESILFLSQLFVHTGNGIT